MTDRRDFLASVRESLGRSSGDRSTLAPPELVQPGSIGEIGQQAEQVRAVMAERAGDLLENLARTAAEAGWRVHRTVANDEVVDVITRICVGVNAKVVLKSGEQMICEMQGLDESLESAGIEIESVVRPRDGDASAAAKGQAERRTMLFEADVGITGSDYAIAETGTVVVHPRRGLSRLISLAPPRHIAVVRRGTILPSLDELFLLESEAHVNGTLASSMNLITGPSRTGDIEGVIVEGIHGPIEVHMVLVG